MSVNLSITSEVPARPDGEPAGKIRRARRFPRRTAIAVAAVASAAAVTLGGTAIAHAQVNDKGPHYPFTWGDCSIDVGNVAQKTGWAVGGVDVSCAKIYAHVSATIALWRWDISGNKWVQVEYGSNAQNNTSHLSAATTYAYCGGRATYWDDIATVTINGTTETFDLYKGLGYYAAYGPPAC